MFKHDRKTALKIILCCGIASLLVYTYLHRVSASRQQEHLQSIIHHYQQAFAAINNQHKEVANILYTGFSRRGDVIDIFQRLQNAGTGEKDQLRDQLLQKLRPRYADIYAKS